MKNEIKINGTQKFMGMDIPVVEGGFGEDQKVILARTVAEIHGVRMNDIQDLIIQNYDEFEILRLALIFLICVMIISKPTLSV